MYPLSEGLQAPKNQWFVAAYRSEVTRTPLGRWLHGEPVVLYRRKDGTAVALDGRCPHRHFPLDQGVVVGDDLQCAYHGIRFNSQGRCVAVPTQSAAPRACDIRSYPLAERGEWVWIWPGNPETADRTLIPDLKEGGLEDQSFIFPNRVYRQVAARYMLLHDNLLDLSHLEHLHGGGIGSEGGASVPERVSEGVASIRSDRSYLAGPCPPAFQKFFNYSGEVDRHFGMTFHAPALHVGYDDFVQASQDPSGQGKSLGRIRVYHAITPGRDLESHYFFVAGRDFARDDDELTAAIQAVGEKTIGEDVFAAESIERMIGDLRDVPNDVLVKGDATCVKGRRLMEQMIRAEAGTV
jgi:vanillate O-demethylase monooxygenase subunit